MRLSTTGEKRVWRFEGSVLGVAAGLATFQPFRWVSFGGWLVANVVGGWVAWLFGRTIKSPASY